MVLAVRGEVDQATAPRFKAELIRFATYSELILDARELYFGDSCFYATLLGMAKRRRNERPLVIRHATPTIQRMLRLTRLDTQLTVENT